jgi:CRISPR-associated protein (TIGR03984 family)
VETKTLIEAAKSFDSDSIAILYATGWCKFARFKDGEFLDPAGNKFSNDDLSTVFEARVFNAEKEYRWRHESEGRGRFSVVNDETYSGAEKLVQKYLLWGEVSPSNNAPDGWTYMSDARVGKYAVPVVTSSMARICAVEYLEEFVDGNMAVIDERLCGIEAYDFADEEDNGSNDPKGSDQ